MNPTQALANRTARLLAEGAHLDRVAYSTETKPREHLFMVEMEHEHGFRKWVSEAEAEELEKIGYMWSDRDHSTKCWCFK